MKKLYEVTMQVTIYVVADDERDARTIAEGNLSDEPDWTSTVVIEDKAQINQRWLHAYPFAHFKGDGAIQNMNCEQVFEHLDALRQNDPSVIRERLEAVGQLTLAVAE